MIRHFIISLILLYSVNLSAQVVAFDTMTFKFVPHFNGEPLVLNDEDFESPDRTISISTLRFYIGYISLYQDEEIVWKDEAYYLIDAADIHSLQVQLATPSDIKYSTVQFLLGVDSLTNTSGAYGGDLDPTKGMYWTWQNGYINFKLEGTSKKCPTRNNEFMFHLGGYAPPFSSVQTVSLRLHQRETHSIQLNVSDFIDKIDLSTHHTFMSPSLKAVELSQLLSTLFIIHE